MLKKTDSRFDLRSLCEASDNETVFLAIFSGIFIRQQLPRGRDASHSRENTTLTVAVIIVLPTGVTLGRQHTSTEAGKFNTSDKF